MVGRPAAEAGSQFYGKNNPLSSEGTVASELQMEFERISNHWHHKEYSNGNTTGNDLISKITCNSLSEYLFFFEQSKHWQKLTKQSGKNWGKTGLVSLEESYQVQRGQVYFDLTPKIWKT